jgi:hypothetical protein
MTRPPLPRLAFALVGLTTVVVGLHWLGRFDLRGPTGLSGSELSTWADDPALVVATVARWLGLAAGWYLLVIVAAVGLLGVPAADSGWRRLVPTPLVGTVAALLGVVAVAAPAASHMARTGPLVAPETATTLRMDNVTPLRLTPDRVAEHPLDEATGSSRVAPTPETPPSTAPVPVGETTEVRTGDSFWSLAEEHLEDVWGRRNLSDAEIVPFWRTLIDANRAELTDPGNPDLLLPGQRLVVPEAPPDPARP